MYYLRLVFRYSLHQIDHIKCTVICLISQLNNLKTKKLSNYSNLDESNCVNVRKGRISRRTNVHRFLRRNDVFIVGPIEGKNSDDFDNVVEVNVVGTVVKFNDDRLRVGLENVGFIVVRRTNFRVLRLHQCRLVFVVDFETFAVVNSSVFDVHLAVVDKTTLRRGRQTSDVA
jgi:hypothetical protein